MKILIVEDDQQVAENLRIGLAAKSHIVDVANDGIDGSFLGRSYNYDAIILDNSLPKKNGLLVCQEIRSSGKSTPIIFLSVIGDSQAKVTSLENGADDYMTKPFLLAELEARLKAVTRRSPELKSDILKIDDLVLDINKQTVERNSTPIHLTRKEFNLLKYLMLHQGLIMSRSLIMEYVWTAESDPFSNTVEAHIRNIRKKLNIKRKPDLILNIPGRGYVIDNPDKLTRFK